MKDDEERSDGDFKLSLGLNATETEKCNATAYLKTKDLPSKVMIRLTNTDKTLKSPTKINQLTRGPGKYNLTVEWEAVDNNISHVVRLFTHDGGEYHCSVNCEKKNLNIEPKNSRKTSFFLAPTCENRSVLVDQVYYARVSPCDTVNDPNCDNYAGGLQECEKSDGCLQEPDSPTSGNKWLLTTHPLCESGYLNDYQVENSMKLEPSMANWTCVKCPKGATCKGGILWDGVRAADGYWRIPFDRDTTKDSKWFTKSNLHEKAFTECPQKHWCTTTGRYDDGCTSENNGRFFIFCSCLLCIDKSTQLFFYF